MKNRNKNPFVPSERQETIRQQLIAILENHTVSIKELSAEVGVSTKDLYGHLEHIQKTFSQGEDRLVTTPAECRKCGFIFRKRDRLTKPGKCPVCRAESIREPFFSIKKGRAR
ncbi:MAG: transcriptional regulator [Dissulfurispiraceae bacterium]